MPKNPEPKCPECEKMDRIHDNSQRLGLFLEWLKNRYVLARWEKNETRLTPVHVDIQKILAEYFDIDLVKVDQEQQSILEWIREENNAKN
jgi:hypothetical protein